MSETYTARGRPVYTLRLGTAERRILEAAAAQHNVALAAYIRSRALNAARRDLAIEPPQSK